MKAALTIAAYGALITVVLTFGTQSLVRAQQSIALADTYEIRTALELYASDHNNTYPVNLSELKSYLQIPAGKDVSGFTYSQLAGGASYSIAPSKK